MAAPILGSDSMLQPNSFVRWGEVPKILSQVLSETVTAACLLKNDGSLLSLVGALNSEEVVGNVVMNMWTQHCNGAKASLHAEGCSLIVFNCELGSMAVTAIGTFYLCVYAKKEAEAGLLRLKVRALVSFLERPLREIYESPMEID